MAHWIIEDKGFGGMYYRCSNCKESWCDIFDRGMSHWKTCPNCGEVLEEDAEEYIDVAKLENALKQIADAASKIHIPKLDVKMFDVSAFDKHIQEAKRRDELVHSLEELTGMSLESLVEKFAAGYTLKEPPMTYSISSLDYKFDKELLLRQIEEFEKKRNSAWPYWGRCEFEKRQDEESLKDMIRRAGYFNAGEPVIREPLVVNVDFDRKMCERSDDMEESEE